MPSPEAVREQLERVLGSEIFADAERARRFLRFVVDRTLAGEGDRLKEYVLGVELFDRDDGYDPRIDSIVRVDAGRLRAKLDQYCRQATDDDVVIRIPRGSYVPVFEAREAAPRISPSRLSWPRRLAAAGVCAAAIGALPAWNSGFARQARAVPLVSILVLPLESFSNNDRDERLAAQLTDGLTGELAGVAALSVVSRTTAQQLAGQGRTLRELAEAVGADVVVEGSVVVGNEAVSLDIRLVDAAGDRKGWRRSFTGDTTDLPGLQKTVAAAVAEAALAMLPQD